LEIGTVNHITKKTLTQLAESIENRPEKLEDRHPGAYLDIFIRTQHVDGLDNEEIANTLCMNMIVPIDILEEIVKKYSSDPKEAAKYIRELIG
jgi:hypothetical protein